MAGNHDHGLVAGWIDARLQSEPPGFLGLEQRIAPAAGGPLGGLAGRARAAPARAGASPTPACGCATTSTRIHGHWSDVHTTVPTFERLAAGAMARWVVDHAAGRRDARRLRGDPRRRSTPGCTRSRSAPSNGVLSAGAGASARAWVDAGAAARAAGRCAPLALGAGYSAAVAAVNAARARPGRARPLRGRRCAAAACTACARCSRRLDISAPHVIWGHSHRSGPWPGDDPAEWTTLGRHAHPQRRLAGSTSRTSSAPRRNRLALLAGDRGPASRTAAPPRLIRLLGDRGHAELRATPGVKQVARTSTPGADLELEHARACAAACSTSATAPGPVDRDRAAVDAQLARAVDAPPTRRRPRRGRE